MREANCAWVSPSELRQVRITEPVSRLGKGFTTGASTGKASFAAILPDFARCAGTAVLALFLLGQGCTAAALRSFRKDAALLSVAPSLSVPAPARSMPKMSSKPVLARRRRELLAPVAAPIALVTSTISSHLEESGKPVPMPADPLGAPGMEVVPDALEYLTVQYSAPGIGGVLRETRDNSVSSGGGDGIYLPG